MKQCKVLTMLFAAAVLFISAAANIAHGQASRTNTVPFMPGVQDGSVQDGDLGDGSSQDDVWTTTGKNVNVTHKRGSQSETSVAVDPTDDNHILMSVNDFATLPERPNPSTTVYESNDAGATFHITTFHDSGICYDGWVAFNAAGEAFVAYDCIEMGTTTQRIAYRKGSSWTKMTLTLGGIKAPDRDMVVVDNSNTSPFKDRIYIGLTDSGNNSAPYVLYSDDGGEHWHPRPLNIIFAIGVNVSIAADGTVYATWEDYSSGEILVAESIDGGASWGTAHLATKYRINTFPDGGMFIHIPPQNVRGIVPHPMSAVSHAVGAYYGRLYISYTDLDLILNGSTSIYVRYSDDGGVTWSDEAKVNDDTVHAYHFHHTIAVAPDGRVGVSFYDTRRDPQGQKKTDQFISFSTDGGTTWTANNMVTEKQSDESSRDRICQPPNNNLPVCNQYGDYQGLAVDSVGTFRLSWTDFRMAPLSGDEDMYEDYVTP